MNRRTWVLRHDVVLEKIINVHANDLEFTINVKRSMTDFELGIQGALKAAFMGYDCSGCWFHYEQVDEFINFKTCFKTYWSLFSNEIPNAIQISGVHWIT